jgi:FixJ family two-component response regulator
LRTARLIDSARTHGTHEEQIAADLKASELTARVHRRQRMQKLQAKPVRMADRLGVAAGQSAGR